MKKIKIALVQASPVLFDKDATIDKTSSLIKETASQNPELIIFPEAYIPAYPRGLSFGTMVGNRSEAGREMWLRYWENSISIPGPETEQLGKMAKESEAYLVIGVIEQGHTGTLYCTMLYFNPAGEIIGKHRKLKPTAAERIIWGEGDGQDMDVLPTSIGKLGGLICWENYMPEARMHLYNQGVEIYVAPTADQRDSWQASMRHIACEGRCFVLSCNQYVEKNDYPDDLNEDISNFPDIMSNGGSVVVNPMGDIVAGPLYGKEGILYAELDMDLIIKGKMDFDVAGHYARKEVFNTK